MRLHEMTWPCDYSSLAAHRLGFFDFAFDFALPVNTISRRTSGEIIQVVGVRSIKMY